MKLPFDLKQLSLTRLIKKNFAIVLWAFLVVVLIMEGFVIYSEISKVSMVQSDPAVVQAQMVRVNLEQHKKLEEQLEANANFEPQIIPGGSSFGITPTTLPGN